MKYRIPRKLKKKYKKMKESYLKYWCAYAADLWKGKAFSVELNNLIKGYRL